VRLCENSRRAKCGLKISKKRAPEWSALRLRTEIIKGGASVHDRKFSHGVFTQPQVIAALEANSHDGGYTPKVDIGSST